mmetsp:Transcript_9835/g.14794  ORF Transcript_9835/g.14794 Transcript_9835/m.14794 type:complete len:129 (+) Transcript_9835:111-497(+)
MKLSLASTCICIISLEAVSALSSTNTKAPQAGTASQRLTSTTLMQNEKKTKLYSRNQDKKKCKVCPDPELDIDMDRREAAFAMMGQLWAVTTGAAMVSLPKEASAIYGADANIELPNVMEGLDNRASE